MTSHLSSQRLLPASHWFLHDGRGHVEQQPANRRPWAAVLCVVFCLVPVRLSYAAISTIGDVTPDPHTTTSDDDLYVGDSAAGTMLVDTGSDVTSRCAYVGDDTNVIGSAIVVGTGSTWANSDELTVGNFGSGVLVVAGGGQVNDNSGRLGYRSGSEGTAIVDGAGSTWTNNLALCVGGGFWPYYGAGTGMLTITNGGHVSNLAGSIGCARGSTGTVTVDGPGSTWTSGDVNVGWSGAGTLDITRGGHVDGGGTIAVASGSTGKVTVDGAGSTWSTSYLRVGSGGAGTLAITNGGRVSSSRESSIGLGEALGYYCPTGAVTVDGAGSAWTINGRLDVAKYGAGTLSITDGGQVSSAKGFLGFYPGATGTATISGTDSTWTSTSNLYVGVYGTGTLNIAGGGHVANVGASIGLKSGSTGAVTVDGPGSTWTSSGDLYLGGDYFAVVSGKGTVDIIGGGTVDIGGNVYMGSSGGDGEINLLDGTLRMHGGRLAKGDGSAMLNFAGGRLEGAGTIDLGAALVQTGGTLAPGNSAGMTTIEGGYTLDGGAIEIEINGLGGAGIDWDLVEVSGTVDLLGDNGLLNGLLDVILGFDPSLGDEFLILTNDGADPIIGMFATGPAVKAPHGDNLYRFAIDYTAGDGNDVGLWTQAVGLWGDYNGNGAVDAIDYTVWCNSLGAIVAPYFGADGSGDGIVNEPDYYVWKEHFGQTAGSGSGTTGSASTNAAVPEPTSAVLLVLAALGGLAFLRQRP
jgi:T5SS/PEP-CTERM-associated repeat protein